MPSKDQKTLKLYVELMEELKVRIHCIYFTLSGKANLPSPIVRELCYQQLRFICELLCLSCLVAHGDIADLSAHKLGRAYSADDIIKKLTRLRPHFYPMAIKERVIGQLPGGFSHREVEFVETSPLTKEDLLTIYGNTHKHLHRGSLHGIMTSDTAWDAKVNGEEIAGTISRFRDLLNSHAIAIDERRVMLCHLARPDGRVDVAFAGRPDRTSNA